MRTVQARNMLLLLYMLGNPWISHGIEAAGPPRQAIPPSKELLEKIRKMPDAEAILKDKPLLAYVCKLLKKDGSLFSPSSPVWFCLTIQSRNWSNDGKMAGFHHLRLGKEKLFFFTGSRLVMIDDLIMGGGERGTSWLVALPPGGTPRSVRVGKVGFDLAGAAVGVVSRETTLYSLAPDSTVYAFSVPEGKPSSIELKTLGRLPLLAQAEKKVPDASALALHSMTACSKGGISVVVEAKARGGSLTLLSIPFGWKSIEKPAFKGIRKPGRVPALSYLGRTNCKGQECLVGFDVRTNGLRVYDNDGKLVEELKLMAEDDFTVQRFCNIVLSRNNWPRTDTCQLTFHGKLEPKHLWPLQMHGLVRMLRSRGHSWVSYVEMSNMFVVVRRWKKDGLGKPEVLPNKHSVLDYRMIDLDGQPCVFTIEFDGKAVNPATPFSFNIYLRDRKGWRFIKEWHERLPNQGDPGGISLSPLYFEPVVEGESLVIYSMIIVSKEKIPKVDKKIIRLK